MNIAPQRASALGALKTVAMLVGTFVVLPTGIAAGLPSVPTSQLIATVDEPAERVPGTYVQGIAVPELGSGTTPYAVPTDAHASWGDAHTYPAVDIFVAGGCGGNVTSPVTGIVVEVRSVDDYDSTVDNPATRGGKSVTIVGDDGVRYYLSHFASIDDTLSPGTEVTAGQRIGAVGTTGRSGACHIHFGISPACPEKEWSVRRGAIDPAPFLNSWRDGAQASPVDAVQAFVDANPDACANAAADPNAPDA